MRKRKLTPLIILIFVITAASAFLLITFITTGKLGFGDNAIILQPGTITYDPSLSSAEKAKLQDILEDITVAKDVTISAENLNTRPTAENALVYDILVPVADFYDPRDNVLTAELDSDNIKLISVRELTPDQKLLSVDGQYFLDTFDRGAQFRTLIFTGDNPSEALTVIKSHLESLPGKDTTLSLAQTGTTAISRAMLLKLAAIGGDGAYFAENIKDFLSKNDLTHISHEVSYTDNCPGGTNTTTLCSDWRTLESLKNIGTDIVELTGNHNNDYGFTPYLNTVAKYEELGWKTFGGGKDEETAKTPLEIDQKAAKITLIGINQSTSTKANGQGASGSNPGANIYDKELLKQQIAEAKAAGRFVIVDVQYYECQCYPDGYVEMPECDAPISGQEAFFKSIADLGADMVIGTQAHQPQTYELYHGKPIYYGLGNLFFDQTYWPGTTRGLILTHYFIDGKYVQTRLSPTVYDKTLQVKLMDSDSAKSFINRLNNAR